MVRAISRFQRVNEQKNLPVDNRWHARIFVLVATIFFGGCAANFENFRTPGELLQPWLEISGAQVEMSEGVFGSDYTVFRVPAAISARGNDLYLVDTGLREIFRYNQLQQTLTPFAANVPVEIGMNIQAAPDSSVYISSPANEKILHFSRDGRMLPFLEVPGELANPISMVVDQRSGRIAVLDGLYDQIIIFGRTGGLISVIKPPLPRSFSAITTGPEGIYLTDRHDKRVVIMGWNGAFRKEYLLDKVGELGPVAVGGGDLMYVADSFDNTIKMYKLHMNGQARLVGELGAAGVTAANFNGIESMSVDEDMLFVADSWNARIQTFLINTKAIE